MSDQIGEIMARLSALSERQEQAVATARREAEADAERRWAARLDAVRDEADRQSRRSAVSDRLLNGIRAIDAARSLADTLTAIARAAADQAPRTALFITSGVRHEEWVDGASRLTDAEQASVAIPLMLDGEQVAVLYGDDELGREAVSGWREPLELIASHGASRLSCITAVRTAQVSRLFGGVTLGNSASGMMSSPGPDESVSSPQGLDYEEEQAARRYARLLVSEIKLYNEAAVRSGREHRDLSRRLASEIERARRHYEQRVDTSRAARGDFFDNELVQTLAGGDASLLG